MHPIIFQMEVYTMRNYRMIYLFLHKLSPRLPLIKLGRFKYESVYMNMVSIPRLKGNVDDNLTSIMFSPLNKETSRTWLKKRIQHRERSRAPQKAMKY
jgi:hypothetical protein